MENEIYSPEQDSYLLAECLRDFIEKNNPKKILDMGTGSGIQAKTLVGLGIDKENIFLADINKDALKKLNRSFPNVTETNLFSNLKIKFDLIIFNPPYLPLDKDEPLSSRLATTGGEKGGETINEFLLQSKKHLTKNGSILLLTSSLTKGIKWQGYKKKLIGKKQIFFEELYVWKLSN